MKIKKILFAVLLLFFNTFFLIAQEKIEIQEGLSESVKIDLVESNQNFHYNQLTIEIGAFYKEAVKTPRGESFILSLEEGSKLLKKGYPDLSKITTSFIVPDHKNMRVNILSSEYQEFENIEIAPSKGNITRDKDPNDIPFVYGDIYNEDKFFPEEIASIQDPYILRDYRGQAVWIYPFQYNAKTKTLRVYTKIVIELIADEGKAKNILSRKSPLQKMNDEFELIYRSHFINYPQNKRYDIVEEEGEMLIISDASYMAAMQDFVDWKKQKGIPVTMVDVEDIGRTASNIDAYIEDFYTNNNLIFVLLVGDGGTTSGRIPSLISNGEDSDNFYGYILGSDHYPEIFVGRFSAESVSDVETQVARVIHYERDLTSGSSWLAKGTGVASDQGT